MENDLIPVEGSKHLYRDQKTGAIINDDIVGFNQYHILKRKKQKEREEIDKIKNDIEEIKSLLKELINGSR
jgi:hypothetical protein